MSVQEVAGQPASPDWARVVLDDGIHILAAKKVRTAITDFSSVLTRHAQAANGVVYMIDDTVKLD